MAMPVMLIVSAPAAVSSSTGHVAKVASTVTLSLPAPQSIDDCFDRTVERLHGHCRGGKSERVQRVRTVLRFGGVDVREFVEPAFAAHDDRRLQVVHRERCVEPAAQRDDVVAVAGEDLHARTGGRLMKREVFRELRADEVERFDRAKVDGRAVADD